MKQKEYSLGANYQHNPMLLQDASSVGEGAPSRTPCLTLSLTWSCKDASLAGRHPRGEGFLLAPSFQVPATQIGLGGNKRRGRRGTSRRMGEPSTGATKVASVADQEDGGGAARV